MPVQVDQNTNGFKISDKWGVIRDKILDRLNKTTRGDYTYVLEDLDNGEPSYFWFPQGSEKPQSIDKTDVLRLMREQHTQAFRVLGDNLSEISDKDIDSNPATPKQAQIGTMT